MPKATEGQFDRFWDVYPKHEGKAATKKNLLALTRDDAELAIAGADAYAKKCKAKRIEPKYIKWPQGWLSERRFEDYIDQSPANDSLLQPRPQRPNPPKLRTTAMTEKLDPAVLVEVLANLWPAAFTADPRERRPLKVGIHKDIADASAGAMTEPEISAALRWYVGAGGYLYRMREGAERIDLDGKPAGVVTADESKTAKELLKARKARRQLRKAAPGAALAPPAAETGSGGTLGCLEYGRPS